MKPVYVSFDVVRIADADDETRRDVKAFAADVATRLQDVIAEEFEDERTYAGALKENTDAYTDSKVAAGYDPRRGHRTGALQDALHAVRLWQVVGDRILFSEAKLMGAIDYATYYAASKARGGKIVGVNKSWVQAIAASMRAKKKRVKRGTGAKKVRITGSLVNVRSSGLGSEIKIGA